MEYYKNSSIFGVTRSGSSFPQGMDIGVALMIFTALTIVGAFLFEKGGRECQMEKSRELPLKLAVT